MVNARWREQYEDAVSTHLRAQEVAGLDICTDGDAHYDEEIGGWSWQSYPLTHMAGFSRDVALTPPAVANAAPPRGMILHDQLEARVLPRITGPLGPGDLQYSAMWKVAQRLTPTAGQVRHDHARAARRRGRMTTTTRTRSSASGRSARRSTRSSTASPMPAAR